MKDTIVLGIETSCDETAASVVVNGRKVLSNIISSQVDLHAEYGEWFRRLPPGDMLNLFSRN